MKVRRILNKVVKEKEYYQYTIALPPILIRQLDWDGDSVLDFEIRGDELVLWRRDNG